VTGSAIPYPSPVSPHLSRRPSIPHADHHAGQGCTSMSAFPSSTTQRGQAGWHPGEELKVAGLPAAEAGLLGASPQHRGLGSSGRMLSPSQAGETTTPGPIVGKRAQRAAGRCFPRGGGAWLLAGGVAVCPRSITSSRTKSLLWPQRAQFLRQRSAGILEEATGVTQELNCVGE